MWKIPRQDILSLGMSVGSSYQEQRKALVKRHKGRRRACLRSLRLLVESEGEEIAVDVAEARTAAHKPKEQVLVHGMM